MSLLPQRKKTPEEIAKLRESLGIPASAADGENSAPPENTAASASPLEAAAGTVEDPVQPLQVTTHAEAQAHATEPQPAPESQDEPAIHIDPAPPDLQGHRYVHSLKRSERAVIPENPPPPEPEPTAASRPRGPKPIRSLKRSEREPLPDRSGSSVRVQPISSALPAHRHSEEELQEIRRQAALEVKPPISYLQSLTAPLWLVAPGYLLPLTGGVLSLIAPLVFVAFLFHPAYALSGGGFGILAGAFIFTKVRSRHHGGFILALSILVLVFVLLKLFDPLKHGS
jgi:hypothetical protein